MKKAVKRLGIVLLVLLAGLGGAALVGRNMFKGTPDFYRHYTWDGHQRSVLNQQAADKLLKTRQIAQQAHFAEVRAQRSQQGDGATTRPATKPAGFEVTFGEEELNAFLFHNAETFKDLKRKYEPYVRDPGIFLDDGRLILAAQAPTVGAVVSLQFAPAVTPEGDLSIRLTGAHAGKLPLPQAFARPHLDKLRDWVAFRTPSWRAEARLDRNGGFNASAVALATSRLLMNAIDDKPSDPVLFMPVDEGETSVPLRVTTVQVKGRALTLSLEPMPRDEREALFAKLKSPPAVATRP